VADDVTLDQVKLVIENAGKHVKGGRVIAGEGVTEMPVQAAAVN